MLIFNSLMLVWLFIVKNVDLYHPTPTKQPYFNTLYFPNSIIITLFTAYYKCLIPLLWPIITPIN